MTSLGGVAQLEQLGAPLENLKTEEIVPRYESRSYIDRMLNELEAIREGQ